jgi:hypothetical protein
VAQLAAGPGQKQHRLGHLAPWDLRRRAAPIGRIEQVGANSRRSSVSAIAKLRPTSQAAGCVSSCGTSPAMRRGEFGYRP